MLELHPLLNPAGYVASMEVAGLEVRKSGARRRRVDLLCAHRTFPNRSRPSPAAVDPHIAVRLAGTATDWNAAEFQSGTANRR